jgi:hypothetical protein
MGSTASSGAGMDMSRVKQDTKTGHAMGGISIGLPYSSWMLMKSKPG